MSGTVTMTIGEWSNLPNGFAVVVANAISEQGYRLTDCYGDQLSVDAVHRLMKQLLAKCFAEHLEQAD